MTKLEHGFKDINCPFLLQAADQAERNADEKLEGPDFLVLGKNVSNHITIKGSAEGVAKCEKCGKKITVTLIPTLIEGAYRGDNDQPIKVFETLNCRKSVKVGGTPCREEGE